MREISSLLMFGIGAVLFVMFFTFLRPDTGMAGHAPNKPGLNAATLSRQAHSRV